MSVVLSQIFAYGGAYLFLYAWFVAVMIVEAVYENERFNRVMARIGALMLIAFIGFRWDTGTDWLAYLRIFYTQNSSSEYDIVVFGIDTGYLLLNRLVFYFTDDYSWFLLLDAAIAIAGVYYFIEKSTKLPNIGVYLFYTSYAIIHFMGSNRRMLAIGLVCIGFVHLKRGVPLWQGWPRWAAPFALAMTFHRTALMALPGLVVSKRAWPPMPVVLGLLACVALGMSGAPFAILQGLGSLLGQFAHLTIIDKLLFYTSGGESQAVAEFDVYRQALLGVLKRSTVLAILITYMHKSASDGYAQRLYNIYVTGCAIYFLMIGSPVFQVASTYYSIVEIALLPIVFSQLPQLKVPYILYLIIAPFFLLVSALSPYLQLYVPYRSIFSTY